MISKPQTWIYQQLQIKATPQRQCHTNRTYCHPLDSKGNYSATSNNRKLVHWLLMGGLLHLVQQGGDWVGCGPTQSPPRCTKCNSPPINNQCTITVLFGDGPLLCGFTVAFKGLTIAFQHFHDHSFSCTFLHLFFIYFLFFLALPVSSLIKQ